MVTNSPPCGRLGPSAALPMVPVPPVNPANDPMKIILHKPSGNFAMIPREILLHPARKTNYRAMVALYELYACHGREYASSRRYAEANGHNYDTWRKYLPFWEDHGFIRRTANEIELFPFDGAELLAPTGQPEKTVAAAVAELPRTEARIPTADRWAAIIKAWDDNKPECYNLFGGKNEGVKIAIGAHMKRLGLPTDAYDQFIGSVLRGCKHDDWWGSRDGQTPKGVFGFGENLDDGKYQRVEQLYRKGLVQPAEVSQVSIDFCDDAAVLAYAAPKGGYDSVLRLHFPDEATMYSGYFLINYERFTKDPLRETPIQKNRAAGELETLTDIGITPTEAWYDKSVFYMLFVGDAPYPAIWSSRAKIPTA